MPVLARTAALSGITALGLALTACDSEAENQVEQQAEAIDEADEAQADLIESLEEGGPNEEAAEEQADAIREEGEETKDRLEDMADDMDAAPQ